MTLYRYRFHQFCYRDRVDSLYIFFLNGVRYEKGSYLNLYL